MRNVEKRNWNEENVGERLLYSAGRKWYERKIWMKRMVGLDWNRGGLRGGKRAALTHFYYQKTTTIRNRNNFFYIECFGKNKK